MKRNDYCQSILIAEDNEDIREVMKEILSAEGYEVYTARNGRDALAKLREIPGRVLVLLDLMMPVMNGWEFLAAQKQDTGLVGHKVVTISAIAAAGSIKKPINLEPLLEIVRKFCGSTSQALASF